MAPECDVLNAQQARSITNVIDLWSVVLGKAMDEDVCGVVTSGTTEQCGEWGGVGVTFGDFGEVFYVRSSPLGRMGQPILENEVRKISVLIKKSATERFARISLIKLWRLPSRKRMLAYSQYMGKEANQKRDRGTLTMGAMGLATHGINVFESRASTASDFAASNNCHTLLSAVASIVRESDGKIVKIETAMTPQYAAAGSLAGMHMNPGDTPDTRECMEQYTSSSWDESCTLLAGGFRRLLLRSEFMRPVLAEDTGLKLIFSAEDVFEQLSFIGFLDICADPFYVDSLPTDMSQPCGLPLLLTIAVRIACFPERWGLPSTLWDDAYAAKEAALFIESIIPSVLSLGRDGVAGGDQQFTIDLVTQLGQKDISELLNGLRSGQLVKKHHNLDANRLAKSMRSTMVFLQCAGIAVCQDLFGVRPAPSGGCDEACSRFGFAGQVTDPLSESREQSAHAAGLGTIVERWPTLRTSTRNRRQLALAKIFVEVDGWLRTGKHNGKALVPTTQAPVSVNLHDLWPTTSAATATAREDPEKTSVVGVAGAPRSAKKKNRRAERVDALLAERSKKRDANQQQCAQQAIHSLFKTTSRGDKRIDECCRQINGEAMSKASGIFEYVLQLGACGGPSVLFGFTSYLVAPTSAVRCAHCENHVHVIQNIAFAGSLGVCLNCGHPRCLECVACSMREGLHMENCHFCCQ